MSTSRKQMSPGLTFAAGTLVGAIAVFVPFSSAGHAGPNIDVSAQRSPAAVRSSAPETAPNFLWWIGDDPRLATKARTSGSEEQSEAASTKKDASKSKDASNMDTCDVQLD